MTIERVLRGLAGFFILVSLLLAYFVTPKWLWLTVVIGVNLFQSAFTNWCPMMTILEKTGIVQQSAQ
jgi:Inner membrane protein YgaP-like, transmembrane domain